MLFCLGLLDGGGSNSNRRQVGVAGVPGTCTLVFKTTAHSTFIGFKRQLVACWWI